MTKQRLIFAKVTSFPILTLGILYLISSLGMHQAIAEPTFNPPPCTDTLVSEKLSPDKLWKAQLRNEFCTGNSSMETTVVIYIKLISTLDPANNSDIFDIDTGGHSAGNPTFAWQSPHTLQISTIMTNYITLQRNSFSGVNINYTMR